VEKEPLPMIETIKQKLRRLALLDAIIEQEWEYRYYSFDSEWSETEEMASLRDGSGGEWFFLFEGQNMAFKCTSPVDGLVQDFEELKIKVPERFSSFLNEPAFSMNQGSCIWYLHEQTWVKLGNSIKDLPNPEKIIVMTASDYCKFVESYFERQVDESLVESVLEGKYTLDMAKQINPDVDIELLTKDMIEIGECT